MTVDLPTLRIGCGIWFKKKGAAYIESQCVGQQLCSTCQHNLDAVKKNATAYNDLLRTSPASVARIQIEAARVAVLALAGKKKIEELEAMR